MDTATPQYMAILQGLQRIVSELDFAMGACERLIEQYDIKENRVAAPVLFFVLLPALFDHLMLAAARLYEKKGDRSIQRLLRIVQSMPTEIPWKDQGFSVSEIMRQQSLIESNASLLEKLKVRRDKVLAHMDKDYFNDPGKIEKDYPITILELLNLLRATQALLAAHAQAVGLGVPISFGDWIGVLTDRMVNTLREHR